MVELAVLKANLFVEGVLTDHIALLRTNLFVEGVLAYHVAVRKAISYRVHASGLLLHYWLLILTRQLAHYLVVKSIVLMERVLALWSLVDRRRLALTFCLLNARDIVFYHVAHLLLTPLLLTLAKTAISLLIWYMRRRHEHFFRFLWRRLFNCQWRPLPLHFDLLSHGLNILVNIPQGLWDNLPDLLFLNWFLHLHT